MDLLFFEGVGAVISAIIVFCGSVWMLLAVIMGPRLAYFVAASVTLGFLTIMGVVWSISPLGPVGQLPEWDAVAIGEEAAELDFDPAAQYPEGDWRPPDTENAAEATQATELESNALDYLEEAIAGGDITAFEAVDEAVVNSDNTRLLDQGAGYGAVTFEPAEPAEGQQGGEPEGGPGGAAVAVLQYDPGNPLGLARTIAAGTAVLFALHLFGLSRSESRARRRLAEVPH
ncbi:MAG: hypothetical protein H0W21_00640 [Actinobacteria bacterium]|nr:hypothetical protein [Actinomycetota bacterium]